MSKPVIISFDPADNPNLARVFADDIARKFWLLYRPSHIVSDEFWATCLGIAEVWRRDKPQTWQEFEMLLSSMGEFYHMANVRLTAEELFPKMLEPAPEWRIEIIARKP